MWSVDNEPSNSYEISFWMMSKNIKEETDISIEELNKIIPYWRREELLRFPFFWPWVKEHKASK